MTAAAVRVVQPQTARLQREHQERAMHHVELQIVWILYRRRERTLRVTRQNPCPCRMRDVAAVQFLQIAWTPRWVTTCIR